VTAGQAGRRGLPSHPWETGFTGPFIVSVSANLVTIAIVYVVGFAAGLFGGRTYAMVAVFVLVTLQLTAFLFMRDLMGKSLAAGSEFIDDQLDLESLSPLSVILGVIQIAVPVEIIILLKYYSVGTVVAVVLGLDVIILAVALSYFFFSKLGRAFRARFF
jgi:hypothetical protein